MPRALCGAASGTNFCDHAAALSGLERGAIGSLPGPLGGDGGDLAPHLAPPPAPPAAAPPAPAAAVPAAAAVAAASGPGWPRAWAAWP
eukprot:scaffold123254_cov60-Phaeocystis_antarctica.AAC.2